MRQILIILMLMLGAFSFSANADNQTNGNTTTGTTNLHLKKKPGRPNAPNRYFITCTYGSGYIIILLPEGIDTVLVTISNNGTLEFSGSFTTDDNMLEIPELCGEYLIECTTSDGRIYEGILAF